MTRRLWVMLLTVGFIFTVTYFEWAYGCDCAGAISGMGNLANFGLNPGVVSGGEAMPGAIAVKIKGEVHCVGCTLEELGLDAEPGDLYQFSQANTHMVIKVTKALPDIAWEMVKGHKLFLSAGENAAQLQHLLSESKAGKQVELIGGVAPEVGGFIPITVKVK